MKTYNLFISHSWNYGGYYRRLCRLLNQAPYFRYRNYSVPRNAPIPDAANQSALQSAIRRKMQPCQVVVVIAGVYSTHSKWMQTEIRLAKRFGKPILAVTPRGSSRISSYVRKHADEVVGWDTRSIVGGIRRLASQR